MTYKNVIRLIKLVEATAMWIHQNIKLSNILQRVEQLYKGENAQIWNQKEITD